MKTMAEIVASALSLLSCPSLSWYAMVLLSRTSLELIHLYVAHRLESSCCAFILLLSSFMDYVREFIFLKVLLTCYF